MRSEANVPLVIVGVLAAIVLAIVLGFSPVEWAILIATISHVVVAEAVNAALERWIDLAKPDWHPAARDAKDLAAGAVLLSVLASLLIGLALFGPKVWHLCAGRLVPSPG